ncbi:RNA 2',3'-cyclic phosphodiesterase [Ectobacillus polymachus]|uniref:RNA 2',3'-cyclic phosphodiesterase n=1 Tax=Ectobacillus polymachus TaxID=1508806 RepID=UPI003A879C2A
MKNHYFFAIPLPSYVKEKLAWWRSQNEQHLSFRTWTHKDDYHITLAFLGEAISALSSFQPLLKGIPVSSFSLDIQGIHTFGMEDRPRILWAGVSQSAEIISLQAYIYEVCTNLGYSLDKRPYQPHITLAKRWGNENSFENKMTIAPLSFSVDSFSLFATHMDATPKYEEIATFPLLH